MGGMGGMGRQRWQGKMWAGIGGMEHGRGIKGKMGGMGGMGGMGKMGGMGGS